MCVEDVVHGVPWTSLAKGFGTTVWGGGVGGEVDLNSCPPPKEFSLIYESGIVFWGADFGSVFDQTLLYSPSWGQDRDKGDWWRRP